MRLWEALPPQVFSTTAYITTQPAKVSGEPAIAPTNQFSARPTVHQKEINYISIEQDLQEFERISPSRIDRPTLIVLPGGAVTDDKDVNDSPSWREVVQRLGPYVGYFRNGVGAGDPEKAQIEGFEQRSMRDAYLAGNAKLAEHILGIYPRVDPMDVDLATILLVSYESVENSIRNMNASNKRPNQYYSDEAMQFVANAIAPLLGDAEITKKNGHWQFQNYNKKPLNEILQRTKFISLQANSAGTSMILQIDVALRHALKHLGFSQVEGKAIRGSICAYGVGNMSAIRRTGEDGMTIIQLEGINDIMAREFNPRHKFSPKEIRGMKNHYFDPNDPVGSIKPSDPQQLFVQQVASNRLVCLVDVPHTVAGYVMKPRGFSYEWIGSDYTGHPIMNQAVLGADTPHYLPILVKRIAGNMVLRGLDKHFDPRKPINPYRLLSPLTPSGKPQEHWYTDKAAEIEGQLDALLQSQIPNHTKIKWHTPTHNRGAQRAS